MRRANWRRPSLQLQTPSDRTSALHTPWPRRWWMSLASKSKFTWKLNSSQQLFDYSLPCSPSLSSCCYFCSKVVIFRPPKQHTKLEETHVVYHGEEKKAELQEFIKKNLYVHPTRMLPSLYYSLFSLFPLPPLLSQHGPCWGPYPGQFRVLWCQEAIGSGLLQCWLHPQPQR